MASFTLHKLNFHYKHMGLQLVDHTKEIKYPANLLPQSFQLSFNNKHYYTSSWSGPIRRFWGHGRPIILVRDGWLYNTILQEAVWYCPASCNKSCHMIYFKMTSMKWIKFIHCQRQEWKSYWHQRCMSNWYHKVISV